MAKYCSEACEPLCDFCIHFKELDESRLDDYSSDGICVITGEEVSIIDYCTDNFECFRCKEINKW